MSRVVCLLSQDISTSSDLLDKHFSLLTLAHFYALLNDIVTVSVLHHCVEGAVQLWPSRIQVVDLFSQLVIRFKELVDDLLLVLFAAMLKALFNDVACEFVIAELNYTALDALDYSILVLLVAPILKNVLNHIISELILCEAIDLSQDVIDDGLGLSIFTVLEDALDHPTTVGV